MALFSKKAPLEREWEILLKKEQDFLQKRQEKKDSFLNQKLEEKVPAKLQSTLDAAFFKAFTMIFEKGTTVIEKTYRKEELEKQYKINAFAEETLQDRKSLKKFSKQAGTVGNKNLLLAGVSGIGMGALGIGLPDIPIFTGMMLKNIYEIALNYGYEYETTRERYFILLLIQGAVSYGEKLSAIEDKVNKYIRDETLPPDCQRIQHIEETAAMLSKELLYMKFVQGIPVVGAVGGAYDVVYMKRITEYARMKYQKRFLLKKREKNLPNAEMW